MEDGDFSSKEERGGQGGKEENASLEFERFWNSFPAGRKSGKAKAREAWSKAIRKIDAESIITAAGEYAASEVGRGEYVKMPATWLNGECWDDDRSAWAGAKEHAAATRFPLKFIR